MRKFVGIIESTTVAPSTNCLWIKGDNALYFTNSKWVSLLAEDATTAQVVGVVNTLLKQFRNCGLIQL